MEIKNVESQITWLVECDNLSYVRTMYVRSNEQFIGWKRNFDWIEELNSKILSEEELEKKFSELNIEKVKPVYSNEEEKA